MKNIAQALGTVGQDFIAQIAAKGAMPLPLTDDPNFVIDYSEVEISSQEMPGWHIEQEGNLTVALDISINEVLAKEGIARELVNRIQNLRKDSGLEVSDRIIVTLSDRAELSSAIIVFNDYICGEVLADVIELSDNEGIDNKIDINGISTYLRIEKV
jgi:isoleucyl-tRNA synthetase